MTPYLLVTTQEFFLEIIGVPLQGGKMDKRFETLRQILEGMEEAVQESNLLEFWLETILGQPAILNYLLTSGSLGFLVGKARELVAPKGEDRMHLISSIYYWESHLAEGIYFKMNGGRENPDMAEDEEHEQVLAQIVKETISAIAA